MSRCRRYWERKISAPTTVNTSETDDDNEVDYDNADVAIESVSKGIDISENSQSSFIGSQISNNCEANEDNSDNSNSANRIFNFFSRSLDLNSFTEDDQEFQKIVENKLTIFLNNNDSSLEFPTELNKTQRSIVHAACEKYSLQHISQGFSPNRKLIVSKIGTILGKKTTQKEISADLAKISIPKIPNNQHVTDLLNTKALTPKRTPKKRGRKPKALTDGDKNDKNENANAQVSVEPSQSQRELRPRKPK